VPQFRTIRTALVTGANKGIGLEIARQIGKAGNDILIGARDPERGRSAAATLRDEGIVARKVNSADPGFTATDLNNHRGYQTIPQGAAEAIRLALLPDDGPTGGFFSSTGAEPW
jgi:NAD(P)-dependent dehydrogenase (short-subunit alcohol dehydrogenase family)